MVQRNLLAPTLAVSLLWGLATARPARADEKEACLAAADQGQSLRDDGHYMLARDQFFSCAREVCPKLVHEQCTEWLRQLDEAMPTVVFGARDQHGNDLTAARIFSDGKLITSTLDGKPVALDPGPHDIRFERDANESVTVHVVLRTGEKNREVSAAFPAAEGTPGGPLGPTTPVPGGEARANAPFWNGRSITSLSLLVAGAAAAGVGAYFGVQSQNEKNNADAIVARLGISACRQPTDATQGQCNDLNHGRDAQNTDAVLNEVLFIGGGVLVASAVATWLLWPKAQEEPRASTASSSAWVAPTVGPAGAGLTLGGAF